MKKTLIGLFTAALMTLVIVPANAQVARDGRVLNRLAEGLELTDSQKTAVQNTLSDSEAGSWGLAATLQRVLTDEQKSKLLEHGKTAQAYGRGLRDGSRTARSRTTRQRTQPAPSRSGLQNRRTRSLGPIKIPDLSDEQQEAIDALRTEQRERMQSLRKEARDNNLDREAVGEQSRALAQETHQQMLEILTDDQRAWAEENSPRVIHGTAGVRRGAGVQGQQRGAQRSVQERQGIRGQRTRAGRSPAQGANMQARGDGMVDALNLTESQQELLQIHRSVAAVSLASRFRGSASRFERSPMRRAR